MEKIRIAMKDTQAAYDYLIKINKREWDRHTFVDNVKVDHVTNSMSELWNSWLNEYRDKPVLTLVEFIRNKVMKRLHKRRSEAKEVCWEATSNFKEKIECL